LNIFQKNGNKTVIAKGMLGENVDKKTLNSAFQNLTEELKGSRYGKYYKKGFNYDKALQYLKTLYNKESYEK
jgi:hypothetical protein